jgi:uncharacterized membrane protein YwzB
MHKFGFNLTKSAEIKAFISGCVAVIIHLVLLAMIFIAIGSIKVDESIAKMNLILSYIVTNTYSALFFEGFCVFIISIYNRFELINECIR